MILVPKHCLADTNTKNCAVELMKYIRPFIKLRSRITCRIANINSQNIQVYDSIGVTLDVVLKLK